MIEHQIQACFEKLGLTEMGKVGEAFDPNLHNAVAHIEDESLGENVIAAVYQKGISWGPGGPPRHGPGGQLTAQVQHIDIYEIL